MEREIWKPVKGYEGLYQVSSLGNVKSLRYMRNVATHNTSNGYLQVHLWRDGKAVYRYVHKLVAEHFLSAPSAPSEINHIDENRRNNCASNLMWCTRSENHHWGTYQAKQQATKIANKKNKPVFMFSSSGELLNKFSGLHEASRITGISRTQISKCCLGKFKHTHGYVFQYA